MGGGQWEGFSGGLSVGATVSPGSALGRKCDDEGRQTEAQLRSVRQGGVPKIPFKQFEWKQCEQDQSHT